MKYNREVMSEMAEREDLKNLLDHPDQPISWLEGLTYSEKFDKLREFYFEARKAYDADKSVLNHNRCLNILKRLRNG